MRRGHWQRCSARDPANVGRARVAAETVAEIVNGFVDVVSWKSMLFTLLSLIIIVGATNSFLSFFRIRSKATKAYTFLKTILGMLFHLRTDTGAMICILMIIICDLVHGILALPLHLNQSECVDKGRMIYCTIYGIHIKFKVMTNTNLDSNIPEISRLPQTERDLPFSGFECDFGALCRRLKLLLLP